MSLGVATSFQFFITLRCVNSVDRPMKSAVARVQIRSAMLLKVQVFWDMTPCFGDDTSQSVEGAWCFRNVCNNSPVNTWEHASTLVN